METITECNARAEQTGAFMTEDLYYIQDSRQYVGNSILWWRAAGAGYTTNLEEAGTYTKAEAFSRHQSRATDKPWLKSYVDDRANRHVDHQKLKREHDAAKPATYVRYDPPLIDRGQFAASSAAANELFGDGGKFGGRGDAP